MELACTNAVIVGQKDVHAQPWGARHVRWGLRMLRPDIPGALAGLSPCECREVEDFLALHPPKCVDQGERMQLLADQVMEQLAEPPIAADNGSILAHNLRLLQRELGLNDVEVDIVAFRALLRLHPGFEALAGKYIGLCADGAFYRKLAALFDIPMGAVSSALATASKLVASGLVTFRRGIYGPLDVRIRLVQGLIGPLATEAATANELLASVLPPKRDSRLQLSAYPHIASETRLLQALLSNACATGALGANVLLHGAPGTGKTELAGALAAAISRPLYASAAGDEDESHTPRERFGDLASLQKLVRMAGGGLVLVDEAEDLFPTVWSDLKTVPTKAAVNECLEGNPTPTIWISNRIGHMDEAFLRRFDMVLRVPPIPSALRRTLLRDALPRGVLSERGLRKLGERRELTAAVLARMAKVATAGDKGEPSAISANLHVLANQYLRSLGSRPLTHESGIGTLDYDPELLNTNPPLRELLVPDTHEWQGARLLLHGAPGTGKTALATTLAERLGKPLLQRQASSLLSCWVGGTERNLRDMFDEARQEDGVLLIDEVDSFLASRDRAHATWEVTQTNELLTQIETFDGTLICTTNRLEDLDPAVLRRFDLKVEFRPLRLQQRVQLVRQCCARLGIEWGVDDDAAAERARSLDGCTPGDASAVLRRLAVTHTRPTVGGLLSALADECRYRPAAHGPIGFVR